jgi:hypothetical protein
MSVTMQWRGVDEMRAELLTLAADLTADVSPRARQRATAAAAVIAARYPRGRTGRLQAGVMVSADTVTTGHVVAFTVRSRAPHAHLVERGTAPRTTRRGWNRGWMIGRPVFRPAMQDAQNGFEADVAGALRARGLTVSGSLTT